MDTDQDRAAHDVDLQDAVSMASLQPSAVKRLAVVPDLDVGSQFRDLAAPHPGPTLLPAPVARVVSFATRSTSLVLRMGTFIGGCGFDAAKATTLSSLELGRGILEGILSRAGRDVIVRSRSELVKADAETILEASLESLHRTMTQVVFWTTTGFQVTNTTLTMVSEMSLLLLSTLDQFFGSTDSSRAIACIITLVRREFENPATGKPGERVGVMDLVLGLSGMAYLQAWCRRLIEEESRRLDMDETVWDVVVLDDGGRVDVHQERLYGVCNGKYESKNVPLISEASNSKILATLQTHGAQDSDDDDDDDDDGLPEIRLKRQILRSLPHDTQVSITTSIATTKTITVDMTGSQAVPLAPPPGVELIEESRATRPASSCHHTEGDGISPTYRVVYRVSRNKERSMSFKKDGEIGQMGFVQQVDDESKAAEGIGSSSPCLRLTTMTPTSSNPRASAFPPPPAPPKLSTTSSSSKVILTTPSAVPRIRRRPSSSASSETRASASSTKTSRVPVMHRTSPENTANQKRPRIPLATSSTATNSRPARKPSLAGKSVAIKAKDEGLQPGAKTAEKRGGFRSALKRGPAQAFSSLLHKEDPGSEPATATAKAKQKPDASPSASQRAKSPPSTQSPAKDLPVPGRAASLVSKKDAPHAPTSVASPQGKRALAAGKEAEDPHARASSRASYISVHERRRDSVMSQTDTYSIHPTDDYRPVSPSVMRAEGRSGSLLVKARSEKDMANNPSSPLRNHRRVKSQLYTPSIYTLKTNESETSLVPYGMAAQRSAFGDLEALMTLRRDGMVDGLFPRHHLLRNISRYMRFASASYGSNFLKVMGISKQMPILGAMEDTHHELRSYAHHTQSEATSILLSSFVDPQGGSDGTGSVNTGVPLVHYISLDHESKAVVLACRGTLGFEDVLADMTCDYDDLVWRGQSYKVHKGVHASARRLLYGGDGRVLVTLKHALEEFADYGLVLTGHSLGGAVTALLGVMLSEPAIEGTSFMTSLQPHRRLGGIDSDQNAAPHQHLLPEHLQLPPGRPIHVFAYGPPGTVSFSLSRATRGLITSIVNCNDLVPYLSLGVLHDFQALSLAFKTDNNDAKVEVRQRIWVAFQTGLADKWYNGALGGGGSSTYADSSKQHSKEDEQWAYAALKVLRASMMSQKLMPPGEVFVVEKTQVLRRDAFLLERETHIGKPATRVVLKYVKDVEKQFREVRFGTSMLTDHSPGKYEDTLNKLVAGVLEK